MDRILWNLFSTTTSSVRDFGAARQLERGKRWAAHGRHCVQWLNSRSIGIVAAEFPEVGFEKLGCFSVPSGRRLGA